MLQDFTPLLAMGLVVKVIIDFIRYLKAGRAGLNGALTLAAVWVGGTFVAWLFSKSVFAAAIAVGEVTLKDLGFADLIIVGLTIAAAGAGYNELTGSIDAHRSTAKPKLLDSSTPAPPG